MSNDWAQGDPLEGTGKPGSVHSKPRGQPSGMGLKNSLILAAIVAVLSFCGSALASYLSDTRGQAQWEREFTAEWRQQILQERIATIERAVLAINNRDSIAQMMSMIRTMSAELTAAILDERPEAEVTVSSEDLLPGLEQRLKVNEMTREFTAAMSLCAIYFGPETREAIAVFKASPNAWWEQEEEAFERLAEALWAELSYDL